LTRTSIRLTATSCLVLGLAAITPAPSSSDSGTADSLHAVAATADTASTEPEAVVYYFHRTFRCQTCLTIEAYIDEALKTHFADALDGGRLLWRPTNVEEPENEHFSEDFALEFNSAILVRLADGKTSHWTNLEKVWDLLENKEEFLGYIQRNVGSALAGGSADAPPEEQP
jgi:hypothetical protein